MRDNLNRAQIAPPLQSSALYDIVISIARISFREEVVWEKPATLHYSRRIPFFNPVKTEVHVFGRELLSVDEVVISSKNLVDHLI